MRNLSKESKIASVILLILILLILIPSKNASELKEEAFKNSEILVCYETLIVSNSNWRLSEDHLINNNSAGYVKLRDCKVKHENK